MAGGSRCANQISRTTSRASSARGTALALGLSAVLGLGSFASLLLPVGARAEDRGAGDPYSGVEEFLVLADAREFTVFERDAIEMQVVERLEVEAQPNLSAADVVAKLPGIRTSQRIQGERAAVSIEGLPPEYTRILVDGQRYTGFVGSVADLEDVPLTNLDRLEIQRGAQGLRQGPDSGGGVINIATRRPPDEGVAVDVWGGFGSDDKALLSASVGAGDPEWGGSTLAFTHDEVGGYDPRGSDAVFVNIGGRDSVRRVDDVYATHAFGFLPDPLGQDALEGALRFGYREEEERYVGTDGTSIGGSDLSRWLGSVESTWAPDPRWSLRSALTYYGVDSTNDIARRSVVEDQEIRGEFGAVRDLALGWVGLELQAGLDVRQLIYDLEESPLPFTPAPAQVSLSGDRSLRKFATTGGAYLALDAALTDRISITAGARLQLDTRFDPAVAPQVGLLLEPTDWLKLRAQYGRSDRYPSLNDQYQPVVAQNGGTYFLAGNPDLAPEQADTWRVGFELSFDETFVLSGTAFWNEIDGLIRSVFEEEIQTGVIPVQVGGGPLSPAEQALCQRIPTLRLCSAEPSIVDSPVRRSLFRKQNLESVRSHGFEAQLHWSPRPWLVARVGYTWLDIDVDSDALPQLDTLPNEPPHTVDLELRLTAPEIGYGLGAPQLTTVARHRSTALRETSGTGLAGFTSTEHTQSSWVVDTRLKLPIADVVSFELDVRNLTNERSVDSNEIRGRTYFGSLRFRWPGS